MPTLESSVDPASDAFGANHDGMLALLAEHDEQVALAVGGGGEQYVARHRAHGKLTARERIELLLDRDAPFLELSPWRPGARSSTSAAASSPASASSPVSSA